MLLAAAAVVVGAALANGQDTHVWITRDALRHLPEGELKDLLADPANEAALVHGSMFPDGGYAVDHDYGETAHWEPFQGRYGHAVRPPIGQGGGGEQHAVRSGQQVLLHLTRDPAHETHPSAQGPRLLRQLAGQGSLSRQEQGCLG